MKILVFFIFLTILIAGCDSKPKSAEKKRGKDSAVRSYYKDGSLRAEIPVKDGKKHGLAVEYYRDGKKFQEIEYKEGLKDGLAKKYYQTGQLAQETNYKEGKNHGLQRKYRENGKLQSETMFYEDEPCKGLKEFLLDGSLKKKYPEIIIETEDRGYSEGRYILKLSLSEKVKEVEFFTGELSAQKSVGVKTSKVWSTDRYGTAEIVYPLLPGQFIMEKVNVIAKIKTALGNYYITEKRFNIAAENR